MNSLPHPQTVCECSNQIISTDLIWLLNCEFSVENGSSRNVSKNYVTSCCSARGVSKAKELYMYL